MSVSCVLSERRPIPPHRRALPLLAVGVGRVLSHVPPKRLLRVLETARIGARPATVSEVGAARHDVLAVSLRCSGQHCLQRSIAIALLCRARGTWPLWCTGVRTRPFLAHAWVEAEGVPVGEDHPPGYYRRILEVGPVRAADKDGALPPRR